MSQTSGSPSSGPDVEAHKRQAAAGALGLVQPGMRLGLGTGTTARHIVELLAERVTAGLDVLCVPTSEATRALAQARGIPLATLDEQPSLDLAIDGADEIGPELALIKGGGGALLREKIVAAAARRFVVVAHDAKLVERLGTFPLPVEVVPFGLEATRRALLALLAGLGLPESAALRRGPAGEPFVTDGGHLILDCRLGRIDSPAPLASALAALPGVVEHGLFLGMAAEAWVAGPDGVRSLTPASF